MTLRKPDTELIEFPFPLREGQIAYFKLPPNLYKQEVKRIINFLNSIVQEEEKEFDEIRSVEVE